MNTVSYSKFKFNKNKTEVKRTKVNINIKNNKAFIILIIFDLFNISLYLIRNLRIYNIDRNNIFSNKF